MMLSNYVLMIANSDMESARIHKITKFIVHLRFLMACGTVLSLIAICRAFLDFILFLNPSIF